MDEGKSQRARRLAAALRANLQRRKDQTRRRPGDAKPQVSGDAHEPDSGQPGSDRDVDRNGGAT